MAPQPPLKGGFDSYFFLCSASLMRKYGITIEDAGLSKSEFRERFWTTDRMSPNEFADWWGEKYDLTPIDQSRGGF